MLNVVKKLTKSEYEKFFTDPLWYTHLTSEMEYYLYGKEPTDEQEQEYFESEKQRLRDLFIELYDEGKIAFGDFGINLDAERKKTDTIVIHHTAGKPDATWQYINIQHLFRLYIPLYLNPKKSYYHTPLWSNHLRDGKVIFCGYHYLVWTDGKVEQMLTDEQIGWHAGSWEVNTRSIAICFVGDLTESSPSELATQSAREIINKYPANLKILGHREIVPSTVCPGNKFLGEGGWKSLLLN